MDEIKIRKISKTDIFQLIRIGKQTFSETFSRDNNPKDIEAYLTLNFAFDKLRQELSDTNSEFYFAEQSNKPIGYLKINLGTSQTEIKNENTLEVERIYVLKDFLGKKIGKLLLDKAIQIAQKQQVDYVWLGVWEENNRAIRFYEKHGFVAFDTHVFTLGSDDQTDVMMRLDLK